LIGGHLRIGDTVELVPGRRTARIRGLQSHQAKIEQAEPGARVAVNLVGIDVDQIRRGQMLALPGAVQATRLLDVQLQVVADSPWPIEHGMLAELFTGAASAMARVRLLDAEALAPGETGWAQLRLREPVAANRYDRFILRLPSPSVTLGGGRIVEPQPVRRHRRMDARVHAHLHTLANGDADAVLLTLLEERGPMTAADLLRRSQLPPASAQPDLQALLAQGRVLSLTDAADDGRGEQPRGLLIADTSWQRITQRAGELLRRYHAENPLRSGMPREELKSRLGLEGELGNQVLQRAAAEGLLRLSGDGVALAQHQVTLSDAQEQAVAALLARFQAAPYTPPAYQEVEQALGPQLAQHLLESGRLVRLSDSVVFAPDALAEMLARLQSHLETHDAVTVAEVRDLFGTSRKYAVAFLEETDRRRITKRVGDARVLR
jgi:selenocysteine-specific elongation factor